MAKLDPSADFPGVFDGFEPVKWSRPGTSLAVELAGALRRPVGPREAVDSAGRLTAEDVAWHLPAGALTTEPRVGDVLADGAGTRWTILSVAAGALGSRWKCVCRDLAAAHGLNDRIDIEKAILAKTSAGAERLEWQPWKTGLAARIEPDRAEWAGDRGRTIRRARYRVLLLEPLEVDATFRVRAADGGVYRVLGSRHPEQPGRPMRLDVERIDQRE